LAADGPRATLETDLRPGGLHREASYMTIAALTNMFIAWRDWVAENGEVDEDRLIDIVMDFEFRAGVMD
jgi:hypothetical protein